MTPSKSFRDIEVWRVSHEWVLSVYKLTATFPREELFGLSSQLRRAAVSVPANIAEGFSKRGRADKARFYNIAQGSLEESRYYLILANDLGYADTSITEGMADQIGRMLAAYIRGLTNAP